MSKSLAGALMSLLITLCIVYWLCTQAFATTVVPLPFVTHPTPTIQIHAVKH